MNDVRPVLRDDVLLDRLALGERPDDAGPAEDLLLALRADSLLAVPGGVEPPVVVSGRTRRVLRVRSTLAGGLVAAAVVAGTCGVAAATAGDPLAGLTGVRDAVLLAAGADDRPPLMHSEAGAQVQNRVDEVAALVSAGRVEEAVAVLRGLTGALDDLPPAEQDLLLTQIQRTAPDVVEAAGLPATGTARDRPSGPGRGASAPDGDGEDERGRSATTAQPSTTPKPTTPERTTVTATTPSATVPPSTTGPPPAAGPPSATGPASPAPPVTTGYAPPPTSSASRPGNGRGTGPPVDPGRPSGDPRPTKDPKPPKTHQAPG